MMLCCFPMKMNVTLEFSKSVYILTKQFISWTSMLTDLMALNNSLNYFLPAKVLFYQFAVIIYLKIETERFCYIKSYLSE